MPAYQLTLLIIGSYLIGAIPTSYLAGRLLKGIDIRKYGSGAASGSNVWHSVARWAMVPVVMADMLKGGAPVAIAAHGLGFPIWAQGVVGLAAIAGHSWSIFLGFSGGRGVATLIGVLLIFGRWELLAFSMVGFATFGILRNSPVALLIAYVTIPVTSFGLGEVHRGCALLGIVLLLILKRITAERPIPRGEWRRVILNRLLLDRDTKERESWIYRKPDNDGEASDKE